MTNLCVPYVVGLLFYPIEVKL
uniref:Uncharacterized protein n=1 Tax=Anguilla anguilla TaxID=7936 RepID=A0A0E9UW85_ANGAN